MKVKCILCFKVYLVKGLISGYKGYFVNVGFNLKYLEGLSNLNIVLVPGIY